MLIHKVYLTNNTINSFSIFALFYFITVCEDGKYISNKVCVDCPGHCKDGSPCNKVTGMCDNGCANQWTGTYCNSGYLIYQCCAIWV